jgi:hypothetical protein
VLSNIVNLAGCTPIGIRESEKCQDTVSATTEDMFSYCKSLKEKQLFKALYGLYRITLSELRAFLQSSAQHKKKNRGVGKAPEATTMAEPFGELKEHSRRTRNNSSDDGHQTNPTKRNGEKH